MPVFEDYIFDYLCVRLSLHVFRICSFACKCACVYACICDLVLQQRMELFHWDALHTIHYIAYYTLLGCMFYWVHDMRLSWFGAELATHSKLCKGLLKAKLKVNKRLGGPFYSVI